MKTLKLANINFAYRDDPVIRNFSLDATEGDIIGIRGPSGSGKTTLFRLMLGFKTPDSGTIFFDDKSLSSPEGLKLFRNQTSWLPQDLDLGEGSVKDVFLHPFSFKVNVANKAGKNEVMEIFDALGLSSDIWEAEFRNLSTGQRQRVGIALIHLLNKSVYLLDEPTSALDDLAKEKVSKLLFDEKRIIISTSHDPWWLDRCSKIIDLNP